VDRFQYYEKGDISNVVSKGTFLMSVDSGYFSIDNRSGNEHYPRVSRNTPRQSLSWKADSD